MVAKRLKRMASNPFYGADTALLEIGIKAKLKAKLLQAAA